MVPDYQTDADMIRDALSKHGPLNRSDLVEKTNLERQVVAKSLYSLKKQGHVIEEGDLLTLTKGAETAQDAPKAHEIFPSTILTEEHGTEPLVEEAKNGHPDTNRIIEDVAQLARAYQSVHAELHKLQTEYASLIADREAYHALKAKLRGLADD